MISFGRQRISIAPNLDSDYDGLFTWMTSPGVCVCIRADKMQFVNEAYWIFYLLPLTKISGVFVRCQLLLY